MIDPERDLVLARRRRVARAVDLRPGGVFRTVMRSPEGQESPSQGCYLEIVTQRKLVWTDALEAGYRPSPQEPHLSFRFTAAVLLEPDGKRAKYTVTPAAPTKRLTLRELTSLLREIPKPDAGYASDVRRAARSQRRPPRSPWGR